MKHSTCGNSQLIVCEKRHRKLAMFARGQILQKPFVSDFFQGHSELADRNKCGATQICLLSRVNSLGAIFDEACRKSMPLCK